MERRSTPSPDRVRPRLAAAVEYATEHSLVYASHVLSPYFVEGTKLFAYEIFHQSGDSMPKHIVMPVGNGSLLLGALKGFSELKKGGHIADIPRLHAVQAKKRHADSRGIPGPY